MKIFFIGKFENIWDEESIARSLENLGHKIFRCEESGKTNKFILERIQDAKPDFVLFTKLRVDQNPHELLKMIKSFGFFTVSWTFDLYFGYARENLVDSETFFQADMVFTTDGGHDEQFKAHRINHFLLRQGIYKPEAFMVAPLVPMKQEIVFVGGSNSNYPYRQQVLAELISKYGDRMLWLGANNTDEIRGTRLNTLYANIHIVFGDTVYSPNYWSNRIYETLGRGGFLIHPRIPGLEKEFTDEKHYVAYDIGDFRGLMQKIDYYLHHPLEADKIKVAGHNYCKTNYNLEERCKTLITTVQNTGMSGH